MQLVESIDRSFKETKKILQDRKKPFLIDRWIVRSLTRLLRPFKHILTVMQKGNEPSLYLVLICVLTLKQALRSFENLVKFNNDNDETSAKGDAEHDDDQYDFESDESDGMSRHFCRSAPQCALTSSFFSIRHAILSHSLTRIA